MMSNRRKEIQNRITKRKKMKDSRSRDWNTIYENDRGRTSSYTSYEMSDDSHPLFKKELILFKVLAAALLLIGTAVLFKHPSEKLDKPRELVEKSLTFELQFAAITDWYEETFGKPIAFLPEQKQKESLEASKEESEGTVSYAVPASGKISQSFEVNGEGIMIETGKDSKVEAMNEGIVIFAGVKDNLGQTIIIQHSNKTESWYGHLQKIDVKLYEFVEKGKELGTVSGSEDSEKGEFYFAIKSGDSFIDPNQVISFDD